jgi:hypothetical protein
MLPHPIVLIDYSCHEVSLLSLQRLNSVHSKPANSISALQRYLASYVKVGVLENPFLGGFLLSVP